MQLTEVKQRLLSNAWQLRSLPSMSSASFYMLHLKGVFYRFDFVNGRVDSVFSYNDAEEIEEFLSSVTQNYQFEERHFEAFEHIAPELKDIRSTIDKGLDIFAKLLAQPEKSFVVMNDWYINYNTYFDWLALTISEDGSFYETSFDDRRILSEIIAALFKNPDLTLLETAGNIKTRQEEWKNKAAKMFNSSLPSLTNILVTDIKEDGCYGFFKNKRKEYVETQLTLTAPFEMLLYKKIPQGVYQEYVFNKIKGGNFSTKNIPINESLKLQIANFEDFNFIQNEIREKRAEFQGGQFRMNNLMVYNENELISPVLGTITPLLEGIRQCFEMKNWYYAIKKMLIPATIEPKILYDGKSELKYIIPHKYVGRFSNEKIIANALLAVWKLLSGKDADFSLQSEIIHKEYETQRIEKYGEVLTMMETAIESGHGIHGGLAEWTFYQLPENIQLHASSLSDARSGGYLIVNVNATQKVLEAVKALLESFLP